MKYGFPLLIKFLMIFFVLGITLWMFGMSFMNILLLCILVTGISLVGDWLILPRYGNAIATMVDFGIVFIVVFFGSAFLLGEGGGIGWAALIPAIVVALGEAFYHKFLQNRFFEDAYPAIDATYNKVDGEEQFSRAEFEHLRTEFSNEFDIGNPDEEPEEKPEVRVEEKKKNYVPHRRKKRHKKNPY